MNFICLLYLNNFYFNIRKIIKKQDIIIDYLSNYDDYIHTKKIKLVPWFDMNDILISYEYNQKEQLYIDKYLNFIINFNKCRRANYNNDVYDNYIENKILKLYLQFNNKITEKELNNTINKYIHNFTDTVNTYLIPIVNNQENKQKDILVNKLIKKIELLSKINLEKTPEIKEIVKEIIVEKPVVIKNDVVVNIQKKYENIIQNYNNLKKYINNAGLIVMNEFKKKDDAINVLLETMDEYINIINELNKK